MDLALNYLQWLICNKTKPNSFLRRGFICLQEIQAIYFNLADRARTKERVIIIIENSNS